MFANMRWDLWELFGLSGELLFFARMLAQWIASERQRRPVIPTVYWYLSLTGACILVAYALHIGSFAVLLPQVVGLFFYTRGLQLDFMAGRRDAERRRFGFDRPDYPWPSISVIVPVHNEEQRLAATLEPLLRQRYPGPVPQVIAALNGCTDNSRAVAEGFPGVTVVDDSHSGMSFGKNLGAAAASGDMLVFVDADTLVPDNALVLLAEAAAGHTHYIGTAAGAPDKGGGVVRACFFIANRATRRKKAHAPGGVMLMDRETFERIGGFDESLPQGTSTDCIWRALQNGATYLFVDEFKAVTSIRRFEKRGIVSQMWDWRRNHKALDGSRRDEVAAKPYEDVR